MFVTLLVLILVAVEAEAANQVSCGNHFASSCSKCTEGNGASWCNGDCRWCYTTGKCYSKGTDCTKKGEEEAAKRTKDLKDIKDSLSALLAIVKTLPTKEEMEKKLEKSAADHDGINNQLKLLSSAVAEQGKVIAEHVKNTKPVVARIEVVEKTLEKLTTSFDGFMAMTKKLSNEVEKQGKLIAESIAKNKRVDGSWGAWGAFVACTKSCGVGQQTRQRHCDNPSPSNGGSNCQGTGVETKSCNLKACEPKVKYITLTRKYPQEHKPSFYCPSGYRYSRHVCGKGYLTWLGSGKVQFGPLTNDAMMSGGDRRIYPHCGHGCDCNRVRIECIKS